MKKLLAICLTVFMVISLMPAVFAADAVTISATGETWIEGEKYTSGIQWKKGSGGTFAALSVEAKYIASNASFHEGKAMNRYVSISSGGVGSVAYIEIPVTVAAEGDYKITLNSPNTSNQRTIVYVGDAEDNYTAVMETTRAGANGSGSAVPTFYDSIGYAHLTTDITKLKFAVEMLSGTYLMYSWDYIKIEPKPAPETVSASETTRIEAENYPIIDNSVTAKYRNRVPKYATYSAGAFMQFYQSTANNASTNLQIPFTVAEDGLYTIKTKLAHVYQGGAFRSKQNIKLDTTVISANPIAKPSGTATTWVEVVSNNQFISAGKTHTITITASADSGYAPMSVDYVEFVPFVSGSVEVPESGALTVQAEDYRALAWRKVKKEGGAVSYEAKNGTSTALPSGEGNYLRLTDNTDSTLQQDGTTLSWILDFTVPADGNYRIITSHAGRVTSHNAGAKAYVDGAQLFSDTDQISAANLVMQLNEKTVSLTAGKHTYKYETLFTPNNTDMYLDYVSFKLLDMPVDLSETETVRIEAEDVTLKCPTSCGSFNPSIQKGSGYSGGEYLSHPDLAHNHEGSIAGADFVVNAPVAGDYTLSAYVLNPDNHGKLSLKVNGATVTGFEDNNASDWATKTVTIPLNEGENTVTVQVAIENGFTYFGLDYVEFTKAEEEEPEPEVTPDSVSYASGSAAVYVNFTDAGKAIVAFYGADGALVGITSADVDANGVIETTVTCAAEPTVCKAFVWDGFTTATPIGVHKTITITK